MPKVNKALLKFNRGVVSEKALARGEDIDRIQDSAAAQNNYVPQVLGPMMLRPGLEYLLNLGSAQPKLMPFVFRVDDTALPAFVDGDVLVVKDDAYLAFVSVSATVTNGDMDPDITGWTDADDAGATSEHSASSGGDVHMEAMTVEASAVDASATATIRFDNDGYVYRNVGGSDIQAFRWLLGGAAGDYDLKVTVQSGTFTSGTTDTDLDMGTDRTYTKTRLVVGTTSVSALFEIREAGVTLASAIITLKATRTNSGGGGPEP